MVDVLVQRVWVRHKWRVQAHGVQQGASGLWVRSVVVDKSICEEDRSDDEENKEDKSDSVTGEAHAISSSSKTTNKSQQAHPKSKL